MSLPLSAVPGSHRLDQRVAPSRWRRQIEDVECQQVARKVIAAIARSDDVDLAQRRARSLGSLRVDGLGQLDSRKEARESVVSLERLGEFQDIAGNADRFLGGTVARLQLRTKGEIFAG